MNAAIATASSSRPRAKNRVGVINLVDEKRVGARAAAAWRPHWAFRDDGRESAVGSRSYLSVEPYHRIPLFAEGQALLGQSPPAYAYALNNPHQFIDPDGRDAVNKSKNVKCWVKSEGGGWGKLPPGSRFKGNVDGVSCENGSKLAIKGDNYSITPQPDVEVDAAGKVSCKLQSVYEKPWPTGRDDWKIPPNPPVLPGTEMSK